MKKNIVGLFVLALVFGMGMAGVSAYADMGSVGQNNQNNDYMRGWNGDGDDFVEFYESMYDLMSEYGMGPGMMGRGTSSWMH